MSGAGNNTSHYVSCLASCRHLQPAAERSSIIRVINHLPLSAPSNRARASRLRRSSTLSPVSTLSTLPTGLSGTNGAETNQRGSRAPTVFIGRISTIRGCTAVDRPGCPIAATENTVIYCKTIRLRVHSNPEITYFPG